MPFFDANGITFHYADDNADRLAFVFQHGLGADISPPLSFFGEDRPFRLISMDCRGHGKTASSNLGFSQSQRSSASLRVWSGAREREIPGARFAEITGKAISGQKHVEDVRREILQFFAERQLCHSN
jgi:pimeloyl-ACP methyl ester carboxylesterase